MLESDSIDNFLEKIKKIQEKFLVFLENEENDDENLQNLNQLFKDIKIRDSKHKFRLFSHLLLKVANNHHRTSNFFSKIDRILQLFKDNLTKYKNNEIFQLFKSNKRILLFLIEEKILTVDEYFVKQIIKGKYLEQNYPQYFAPEIAYFIDEEWFPKYDASDEYLKNNEWVEEIKTKLPDNFYELRKNGENESYICELIREDLVEEFIAYVSRCCIKPNALIVPSIYETNKHLLQKQENITLIEYAAFFGSIQIFTFLKNQEVELAPSLWYDVIHSKNADLIHLLEYNHVDPIAIVIENHKMIEEKTYKGCFNESVKCHHNEIAEYFLNNYLDDPNSSEIIIKSFEYYNFAFLQKEHINEYTFCHLCHYDYYSLAEVLFTSGKIDINRKGIQKHVFE